MASQKYEANTLEIERKQELLAKKKSRSWMRIQASLEVWSGPFIIHLGWIPVFPCQMFNKNSNAAAHFYALMCIYSITFITMMP